MGRENERRPKGRKGSRGVGSGASGLRRDGSNQNTSSAILPNLPGSEGEATSLQTNPVPWREPWLRKRASGVRANGRRKGLQGTLPVFLPEVSRPRSPASVAGERGRTIFSCSAVQGVAATPEAVSVRFLRKTRSPHRRKLQVQTLSGLATVRWRNQHAARDFLLRFNFESSEDTDTSVSILHR